MITVRRAIPLDAGSMAKLLNEIIAAGGTTALTEAVTADALVSWMTERSDYAVWHVALDHSENVVGFQYINPNSALPPEATDIATFVKMGLTGLGIGSKLFEATANAAKDMGFVWINANIRADNEGGLVYYQSRGFRDYGVIEDYELEDGTKVDKILKRFDI